MSEFNFNWDSINGASDPFADKKKTWETDTRFYKLKRDDNDNGAAVVRFLPDGELRELNGVKSMGTLQKVIKINANNSKNGKRRFVSEYSPRTIGLPDPFYEEFGRLYNAGLKDEAKKFGTANRYIANIYIVRDPAAPENEGKVFLLDISETLAKKIEGYLQPSEQEKALGTEPVQLFNPINGYNFLLKCGKGGNGFINYDASAPAKDASALFKNNEEAINFIKEKCYKLSEFTDPKTFLSYDELKQKLAYVKFEDFDGNTGISNTAKVESVTTQTSGEFKAVEPSISVQTTQTTQTEQTPQNQPTQSKQSKELDDLLSGLM